MKSEGPFRLPRALPGFEHVNRYWDKTRQIYAAKILPGEFYVTGAEELVTTVLGSCVSACVWDPLNGIGGMNHFMLPHDRDGSGVWGGIEALKASTRYGTFAMERLINEILKYGGQRRNLQVKAFGGGRVMAQITDVGQRNIEFVRNFIHTEALSLLAEDLGGPYPRKVIFFPKSGRVLVKKLRVLANNTVFEREQRYMRTIDTTPVQGEVELF